MVELKIQKVDGGLGVKLPQEVLNQLQTSEGESIFLENMFNGSYRLVQHDEELAEKMMLVDGQMHEEDA